MPLPVNLDAIDLAAIERLIGTDESYTIDFKRALAFSRDGEEAEKFCTHIASLANERGGHFVIGVTDRRVDGHPTGIAEEVVGIPRTSADALSRRIEDEVRFRVEPPLSIRTHQVPMLSEDGTPPEGERVVLVVRVPRSANAPHGVRLGDAQSRKYCFHGRSRTGRAPLNVAQVRERFLLGGEAEDRLAALVERMVEEVSPERYRVTAPPTWLVHVLPQASLLRETTVDVEALEGTKGTAFHPSERPAEATYNAKGVRFASRGDESRWVQVYRDGRVEYGQRGLMREGIIARRQRTWIEEEALVATTTGFLLHCLRGLQVVGVDPPYHVAANLLTAFTASWHGAIDPNDNAEARRIDGSRVDTPWAFFDDVPKDVEQVFERLRPLVGGLLNAGGLKASQYYDEQGRWSRARH